MRTPKVMSIALAISIVPATSHAQHPVRMASLAPTLVGTTCFRERPDPGPSWETVMESLTLDREASSRTLRVLLDSLAVAAAERPEDVATQYLLATVLGARAEVEVGRSKLRVAQAILSQVEVVLALDPNHAGALHMMGRLHAAVMRMDRVTRFVATRLLGGAKLDAASWHEAERFLESARSLEPCTGDHYYQLARVYADQGKRALAATRLREFLELGPSGSLDPRVWELGLALADELASGREQLAASPLR
jgi:tetratricopeptide (TPR) repeat protein